MIIGITGYKRHGKDSLAHLIQDQDPEAWSIHHFAGPLKQMTCEVFDLDPVVVWEDELKEAPFDTPIEMDDRLGAMRAATGLDLKPAGMVAKHPRHLLQYFGTEYVRATDPDYWFKKLDEAIEDSANVLIPDTRFLNEAQYIWGRCGQVVKVERVDLEDAGDPHASEREIDKIAPDLLLGTRTGRFELQNRVAELIGEGRFEDALQYDYRNWWRPRLIRDYYED